MALPQNPLSDIQIINTLKNQNDNLSAQTKVLHKLSDSVMDQRKEFAELRKDIRNSQREFLQGNQQGMSAIQKYFEKYKADNKNKSKEESASAGFFKSAVNKLFGPSKYQQKMMEEASRIRELTESSALSLNFLRQVNEEGPRKRERDLLAKAIAEKLGAEIKDSQEGGEKGGGLLSGLLDKVLMGGQLVLTFLGTTVVPLITGIITAVGAMGAAIVAAIGGLAEALAIGSLGGGLGSGGGGGRGGRTGPRGTPIPGQLQLEGRGGPRDMGTLRQNRAGTYVPEGSGGISIKGIVGGASIAAMVAAIGYELFGTSDEDIAKLKAAEEKDKKTENKNIPSFAERWKSIKWFDNENTGEMGDRPGEAWDKLFNPEKIKWSKEQDTLDKETDTLADTTKKINESIKKMLDSFNDMPKKLEQWAIDKLVEGKDFVVDQLNQLGEINFGTDTNPQKINLLPGLGNAVWDTLKEAYDETEAMTNKLTPNAQMFSQSITQNVTNGGVPTISAAQITAEGTGTKMMDMFRTRRGLR
jgi:hypothetical protein